MRKDQSTLVWLLPVVILSGSAAFHPAHGQVGRVLGRVPDSIQLDAQFLFYLHGRIIESEGRRPRHPEFGVYEYDAILRTFSDSGLTVVSEARSPETQIARYAEGVVRDIQTLLEAGVPPRHITVMGFSKGGIIAIASSSLAQNLELNFVFLAACGEAVFKYPELRVAGRILSVFESTDELGVSCQPLFERSRGAQMTSEIEISTGRRHGAFYLPLQEWVGPVLAWIGEVDR